MLLSIIEDFHFEVKPVSRKFTDQLALNTIEQIHISVTDIDESVAFYRDILGMNSCSRFQGGTWRSSTVEEGACISAFLSVLNLSPRPSFITGLTTSNKFGSRAWARA